MVACVLRRHFILKSILVLLRWYNQHVTGVGRRKNLSPRQDSNLWPPKHRASALSSLYPPLKMFHLSFFHCAGGSRHCSSSMQDASVSNKDLVYGLALHEFSVAHERLPSVWELIGSNPVGDWDFFFVPHSWHADYFIFTMIFSPILKFTIFHSFTIFILYWNISNFLSVAFFCRPTVGELQWC